MHISFHCFPHGHHQLIEGRKRKETNFIITMSQYINQQQAPVTAYPAVGQANTPASYANAPPPPVGYPTKDGPARNPQQSAPVVTTSRGEGFWEGCCAGLCCCCALDCCL